MKRLVFVFLMLAGSAYAQPPKEIAPSDQISLGVGQTKVFQFEEPVGKIEGMNKSAEAVPQSDRQIAISGLEPGVTQMFVFSPQGRQIYSASIVVSPEPGHLVKIYGTGKNDDMNAGYMSVYCDELGCGRPDKDLPRPTAVTIERVSRMNAASGRSGF